MGNFDRLTGLDASFLHLEDNGPAHMHVASLMIFDGRPPSHQELIDHVVGRLHLVPRYRQRIASVPLGQGRPVWVDDPYFTPSYHVRHTGLPRPGDDEQLKRLAGRLFSQALDRSKPLWELWLVERLEGERFAIIAKTHHALVDGVSGVDITTVLFDASPAPPAPPAPPPVWHPLPTPGPAKLLAEALLERATVPGEIVRGVRRALRTPRRIAGELENALVGLGATAWAGLRAAPPSPLNVDIGPHRRYTWVDADLDDFKAIKNTLGGTLNDAVLTSVTLALGAYLRSQGHDTTELELRAMVPVSVRADAERGALGNRVAAMFAPLPVGIEDPRQSLRQIRAAMDALKQSGQAVGAQVLTGLAGFAPPTVLTQAARLQSRQRFFNLVVTNVPGPQFPLYLLGRRMRRFYPVVPLAKRQALGIAIMSYDGKLGFGLLGDYDALPALELVGHELERAIAQLQALASAPAAGRAASRQRRVGARPSPPAREGAPPTETRPAREGAAPAETTPAREGAAPAGATPSRDAAPDPAPTPARP